MKQLVVVVICAVGVAKLLGAAASEAEMIRLQMVEEQRILDQNCPPVGEMLMMPR